MHLNKCKAALKPDVVGIGKYPGRICDPTGKGRDTSAFCNINAWSKGGYPRLTMRNTRASDRFPTEYMHARIWGVQETVRLKSRK